MHLLSVVQIFNKQNFLLFAMYHVVSITKLAAGLKKKGKYHFISEVVLKPCVLIF